VKEKNDSYSLTVHFTYLMLGKNKRSNVHINFTLGRVLAAIVAAKNKCYIF